MLRTSGTDASEPGMHPNSTALEQEGFVSEAEELIASFARNFLVAVDAWRDEGFAAVARSYLERLPPETGLERSIAENGDLLTRHIGKVDRRGFLPALQAADWYDAATKAPRL
jgi:hypothetical protein